MNSVVDLGWMTVCNAMKLGKKKSALEQPNTDNIPSRCFWYGYTQKGFATFTKLSALSDESQSIEVHVCTAHDGDKTLVCTDKLLVNDVPFEAS